MLLYSTESGGENMGGKEIPCKPLSMSRFALLQRAELLHHQHHHHQQQQKQLLTQ